MKKPIILTETCRCKNKGSLEVKSIEISVAAHSKPLTFQRSVPICKNCRLPFLDEQLQEKLQKHAKELIVKREGLLTGDEIKEIRESLNMSKNEFGKYLHVLPLSVYLWENRGRIQNKSTDELIRLKCDLEYLEAHKEMLKKKLNDLHTNKVRLGKI